MSYKKISDLSKRKKRDYKAMYYKKLKERGICTRCLIFSALPERTKCEKCAELARLEQRSTRVPVDEDDDDRGEYKMTDEERNQYNRRWEMLFIPIQQTEYIYNAKDMYERNTNK